MNFEQFMHLLFVEHWFALTFFVPHVSFMYAWITDQTAWWVGSLAWWCLVWSGGIAIRTAT